MNAETLNKDEYETEFSMTSSNTTTTTPSTSGRPQSAGQPQGAGGPAIQRQFVSFAFFRLDPEFRRLTDHENVTRLEASSCGSFKRRCEGLICLTYSTVGLKADSDFLLWRIGSSPDLFQAHQQAINKSRLGGFLTTPYTFLAMTKRSMYIDKVDPFHTAESRTHIVPGKRKYLFVLSVLV